MKMATRKGAKRARTGRAVFYLREPTDSEKKNFFNVLNSVNISISYDADQIRAKFFDILLTGVENLLDSSGKPITIQQKGAIPIFLKKSIIQIQFEGPERVVTLRGPVLAYPGHRKGHPVQLCGTQS